MPRERHSSRLFLKFLAVFGSIFLSLAGTELALRSAGIPPWRDSPANTAGPTLHEEDPVLGWRNKAGRYRVPPSHPSGAETLFTSPGDGLRRSSDDEIDRKNDRPKLVFVGGSFTQGAAISDRDTFAWKVQERFPSVEVLNYGTAAYGTYQSLLTLERALPTMSDPRIVVYGFIEQHELRNVAPASWMEGLSRRARRGHVNVPYVTISRAGVLSRHRPEAYPNWPLKTRLALVTQGERAFARLSAFGRGARRREATEQLLIDMDDLSDRHGATLVLALLDFSEQARAQYQDFLNRANIMTADCVYALTPDMRVLGDGHPNGKLHSKWATCIGDVLRRRV